MSIFKALYRMVLTLTCLLFINACTTDMLSQQRIPVSTQIKSHPPMASLNLDSTLLNTARSKKYNDPLLDGLLQEDIDTARRTVAQYIDQQYWRIIDQRALLLRGRILPILSELQLPKNLQLIPVVESAYQPYALSHAGAMGLWQIMPRTAQHLHISSSQHINGKRHIEISTRAALHYLQSLYQRFDSWPLAFAAYHVGPNALSRRLQQKHWQADMGLKSMPVPKVTLHYVQKIIGLAALIDTKEIVFSQPLATKPIIIKTPIDLVQLEKGLHLSKNLIFKLNPALNFKQYLNEEIRIHLPLYALKHIEKTVVQSRPKFIHYRIQKGDSLYKIAKIYHSSVHQLRRLNPQIKSILRINQQILVPARHALYASLAENPLLSHKRRIYYKVRSGDTLWQLAKRFGTTAKAIAKANQLRAGHMIHPGERLWIHAHVQPG